MVAACPFPSSRGTPIRIYRMADELGRRGHEVDVFTYHLGVGGEDAAFRIHRIPTVRTYHRQAPGPSYQKLLVLDPLLAAKLVSRVRRGRYDVLHAHHAEGLLAALPAHVLHRVPVVFDVHTLLETELPYYRMGLSRGLLKRLGRFLDARLPPLADHVIAVSEEIRTALHDDLGYGSESISVVSNGVESAFSEAVAPAAPATMKSPPTIVYAGTLASFQRIDLLLRSFAAALARRADLWLHIYTESPFAEFESLAEKLGIRHRVCVASVGLDQLPARLATADVAVSSRTECAGVPQKMGNYMAAGCPIVSFKGSAKHIVHGQTGLVVPDHDTSAFADGMLKLVDDRALARKLGAAAREFARHELGWSAVAARVEAVYERVACRP
jgi:glycosyltransferase involved in cell wall biosynthesis